MCVIWTSSKYLSKSLLKMRFKINSVLKWEQQTCCKFMCVNRALLLLCVYACVRVRVCVWVCTRIPIDRRQFSGVHISRPTKKGFLYKFLETRSNNTSPLSSSPVPSIYSSAQTRTHTHTRALPSPVHTHLHLVWCDHPFPPIPPHTHTYLTIRWGWDMTVPPLHLLSYSFTNISLIPTPLDFNLFRITSLTDLLKCQFSFQCHCMFFA